MHQSIAPMAESEEVSVDDRIQQIEAFLAENDKVGIPPGEAPEPTKLQMAPPPDDVVTLLKKISENQEIDRKRYERFNPISNDEAIYDWAEATINPGQLVQFIYTVGEGRVFYLQYPNITHNVETTYSIWIDGEYQPYIASSLEIGLNLSYLFLSIS